MRERTLDLRRGYATSFPPNQAAISSSSSPTLQKCRLEEQEQEQEQEQIAVRVIANLVLYSTPSSRW